MHRLLALVVVIGGCAGSSRAPAAPAPAPVTAADTVALTDPCDGGELTEDPCAGGEAKEQVAVADPCDGGEAQGGLGLRGTGEGGGGTGTGIGVGTIGSGSGTGYGRGGGPAAATRVTLGKLAVEGKLAPELVSRVLRRYIAQLRYCYEKTLAARPDVAGRLTLDLVISPEGTVAQAKASGVTPELETCVMQRAMTWKFAKPTSGVVKVSIPISFAPQP